MLATFVAHVLACRRLFFLGHVFPGFATLLLQLSVFLPCGRLFLVRHGVKLSTALFP